MGKVIITLGREFGTGGHYIGKLVAEKLGIKFYDKELIAITAKEGNVNAALLKKMDESSLARFYYAMPSSRYMGGGISPSFDLSMNDKLFLLQSKVIREIADNDESAMIVGRCADYVLRDRTDVLNVFIHAPLEKRIENAIKNYNTNPDEAKKLIKKTDDKRSKYYNYYSGKKWGNVDSYNLSVDCSIGLDAAVEIIATAAREMMKK